MPHMSFLATDAVHTGLDTNPIIVPIQKFGKEFHRTISGLPLQPCVGGAPSERLMMSWWAGEIHIWRIPGYDQSQRQASQKSNELDPDPTRKLAASIVIQVRLLVIYGQISLLNHFYRARNHLRLLTWRQMAGWLQLAPCRGSNCSVYDPDHEIFSKCSK